MARQTTIKSSLWYGGRSPDAVTVSSVSWSTDHGTITLSSPAPLNTIVGDVLTDSAGNKYVIATILGSDLVCQDWSSTTDPATGAATIANAYDNLDDWRADLNDSIIYKSGDDAVGVGQSGGGDFDETLFFVSSDGNTVGLNSIKLTNESDRHDGRRNSGVRLFVSSGSPTRLLQFNFTAVPITIENWEIGCNNLNVPFMVRVYFCTGEVTLNGCQVYGQRRTVSQGYGIYGFLASGRTLNVLNTTVYDCEGSSDFVRGVSLHGLGTYNLMNSTVHGILANGISNDAFGVHGNSGANITAKNVLVTGTGGTSSGTHDDFTGLGSATKDSLMSSDSTADGTNAVTGVTPADQYESLTAGSEDLRLTAAADAIDAGADLGTTPAGVNIDCVGRDRDAEGDVWDVGWNERAAAWCECGIDAETRAMSKDVRFYKYGQAITIDVTLHDLDGVKFKSDATFVSGDVKIKKDGVESTLATLPTDDGTGYSLSLSATDLEAARISLFIADQDAPQTWLDCEIKIETYGHASAQHPALPANVIEWQNEDVPAPDTAGHPKVTLKTGTGAGEVNINLGVVESNTKQLDGGAGAAANLKLQFDGASGVNGNLFPATQAQLVELLDNRLTALRAGFLENLNIGGLVASNADILGITQAQRVRVIAPQMMERPDAGSIAYRVHIYAYNEQHQAEDLDANPTVTAENNMATDRSVNLSAVTKVPATTGQYYVDYTLADSHEIEGLTFKVTAVENAVSTLYAASTLVVDTTAVDFTAADRTTLLDAITHLTDIKGDGFVKNTHSLLQCLTAAGFATPVNVTDAQAAIINAIPAALENADALLGRDVANVDDTAAVLSLCAVILSAFKSNVTENAGNLTVKKADGTEFNQYPVTSDGTAEPITGVG